MARIFHLANGSKIVLSDPPARERIRGHPTYKGVPVVEEDLGSPAPGRVLAVGPLPAEVELGARIRRDLLRRRAGGLTFPPPEAP